MGGGGGVGVGGGGGGGRGGGVWGGGNERGSQIAIYTEKSKCGCRQGSSTTRRHKMTW